VVRIALGQINTTVGDLDGNVETMVECTKRATESHADIVCFPELAITGYPPEDLVLRPEFVRDNLAALEELAERTIDASPILTGFVDRTERGLHNAAALVHEGRIVERYHKVHLPNFGVFDERRYFVPGDAACSVRLGGSDLGVSVCEDAWHDGAPFDEYARRHTPVVLNINASPYHRRKVSERLDICRDRALQTGAWIVYVNAVGGQDELVFDGGSMLVSPDGDLAAFAATFEEDLLVVDVPSEAGAAASTVGDPRPAWPDKTEEIYRALVLGLRDYVVKNDFRDVPVGIQGGIDSALTAVIAADALGPEAVRTLSMPSPYSSPESTGDAVEIARRLDIRIDVVPIERPFSA
jgi:NAD+ synthase (glutamine-hydrolysing)